MRASRVIEINIGKGHRADNLAYIHKSCDYSVFAGEDAASKHSEVNLFALIGNVMDEAPDEDSPYKELTEYFRLCERTPFTLTFSQIEDIIFRS